MRLRISSGVCLLFIIALVFASSQTLWSPTMFSNIHDDRANEGCLKVLSDYLSTRYEHESLSFFWCATFHLSFFRLTTFSWIPSALFFFSLWLRLARLFVNFIRDFWWCLGQGISNGWTVRSAGGGSYPGGLGGGWLVGWCISAENKKIISIGSRLWYSDLWRSRKGWRKGLSAWKGLRESVVGRNDSAIESMKWDNCKFKRYGMNGCDKEWNTYL